MIQRICEFLRYITIYNRVLPVCLLQEIARQQFSVQSLFYNGRDGRVTDRKTQERLHAQKSTGGRGTFNSPHSGAEWRAFRVPLWHGLSIEVRPG